VFPIAAPILPAAAANGLSRAPRPSFHWTWLIPAAIALVVWVLESRSRRLAALWCIAAASGWGAAYLKTDAAPELDRLASARQLWSQVQASSDSVCVQSLKRDLRYGLNYYSGRPLPDCAQTPKPIRVVQIPGEPPAVSASAPSATGPVDRQ
jgi:hypothetical protein